MFLKLVEIKNNTESIIDLNDTYFTVNVEKIYNYLRNINPDLLYSIDNEEANIFINTEIMKRGYVWNSKSVKKVSLYKITKINQLLLTDNTDEIPKSYTQLKREVLDEIKSGKKLIKVQNKQYGLGYASNLISTQFPLKEYAYPNKLSIELLSKMKLLRLSESESESDSE